MTDEAVYAQPRRALRLDECQFYHTMDIPGVGQVEGFGGGNWDLRGCVDEMLSNVPLKGKRLLEVGPASGYLTFEMERRGAEVVAVDAPFDHDWDIVPFPSTGGLWRNGLREAWQPATNAWWFAHEHFGSRAKMCYASGYDIDKKSLGRFQVAVMANVLLHNRDPLKIIQNCAKATDETLTIVEQWQPDLEPCAMPIVNLQPEPHPIPGHENWNTWWRFSTRYFINFLTIIGFEDIRINRFHAPWNGQPFELFTLTASKA